MQQDDIPKWDQFVNHLAACRHDGEVGLRGFEPEGSPVSTGTKAALPQATNSRDRHDFVEIHDDFARAAEIVRGDCLERISRARARYLEGDAGCEADYQAAFLLDAKLAASELIRQLEAEIRDDVVYLLMNCRKRLAFDPGDVVSRTRLGLALLLLFQDAEAFHNLQRAFLRDTSWRPHLRLLVNEAKQRRASTLPRILGSLRDSGHQSI
jgi:hypothetical protein